MVKRIGRPQKYSQEVRDAAVRKMLALGAPSVLTLARELQISEPTLHKWKAEALSAQREKMNSDRELEWMDQVKARSNGNGHSNEVAELRSQLEDARATINKLALRLLAEHHVI